MPGTKNQKGQPEVDKEPVSSALSVWLRQKLKSPRSSKEMGDERNHRKKQQQMNQAASDMEHQKACLP